MTDADIAEIQGTSKTNLDNATDDDRLNFIWARRHGLVLVGAGHKLQHRREALQFVGTKAQKGTLEVHLIKGKWKILGPSNVVDQDQFQGAIKSIKSTKNFKRADIVLNRKPTAKFVRWDSTNNTSVEI